MREREREGETAKCLRSTLIRPFRIIKLVDTSRLTNKGYPGLLQLQRVKPAEYYYEGITREFNLVHNSYTVLLAEQ